MNPDDPLEQLKALKSQQVDPLEELKKLRTTKPKIGQMGHAITEDASAEDPSYAQKALGGIAALAHDIPGAEALQAGARSVVRGQLYSEALSDIQGAEEAAPKAVRIGNNVIGGTVAALAGPKGPWVNPFGRSTSLLGKALPGVAKVGSAAVQGARFGAAQGALSADPASIRDRLIKAGKGGVIGGAVAGVVGDIAPNVARVISAKSLGTRSLERGAEMTEADQAYTRVLAAARGQSHPDVTAALNEPFVRPYAKAAVNSPSLAGADDATILHETYTRLGTRQRALQARTENAESHLAGPEREIKDIELAKQKLLAAADKLMPGYRDAVTTHAKMEGQYDAFTDASDAMNRVLKGKSAAGRNLDKNTPEAWLARIIRMDKEKAEAAREAVLGRVQEQAAERLSGNPVKGWGFNPFGVTGATATAMRGSPWLRLLDEQINGPASASSGSFSSAANGPALRSALAIALGSHAGN